MNDHDPIAIVGLGGVLPGAADLASFWQNIRAGRSAARVAPPGRWTMPGVGGQGSGVGGQGSGVGGQGGGVQVLPDRVYSARACFLDSFAVDSTTVRLSPELLGRLDAACHVLLEAGRRAWEDAVTGPVDRRRVGVIVGNIVLPTESASRLAEEFLRREVLRQLGRSVATTPATSPFARYAAGLPAGVLAQGLGLGGGTFTLDAACASSLYAVKLACDELRAGRADVMLAGGVSRPDSLYTQMGFSQLRALSPSGVCRPFDAAADGLVVGEGAGVVVLKRLADALAHGDRIYATIAGIGLSNDIGGNLMSPDAPGQLRALTAAYRAANLTPSDIDLIECHGTGTPIGDGVELESLLRLWDGAAAGRTCVIGSVKSNIGHLLTAAGAAGLIKVLLALEHETIPPTANGTQPAARLQGKNVPLRVLTQAEPWTTRDDVPRRAAVSGFGFGGINAHVILEAWSPQRAAMLRRRAPRPAAKSSTPPTAIAVVGWDARWGACDSRLATQRQLLGLATNAEPRQPLPGLTVALDRFRIPPAELAEMLPQQLWLLDVAARALDDAGLNSDEPERLRWGVWIGVALDMNATNFHARWSAGRVADELAPGAQDAWTTALRDACGPALSANRTMGALGSIVASRVARAFRIGGPSFTISSEETSGLHALATAVRALRAGEVDVAIVGAVDLPCDPRWVGDDPRPTADAAGVVILKRYDDALVDGDRVTGLLRDIECHHEMWEPELWEPALWEANPFADDPATTTLPHCGAATGFMAFLQMLSALDASILPPQPDAAGRLLPPRPWLRDRAAGPRQATVTSRSVDGNVVRATLEAAAVGPAPRTVSNLPPRGAGLFVVRGTDSSSLAAALQQLRQSLAAHSPASIDDAARHWHHATAARSEPLCLALVAETLADLDHKIDAAFATLANDAPLPEGVHFTRQPLGRTSPDGLAFVYPGAGNQFAGMGRDLALHFPGVLARLDRENDRLATQFGGGKFWSQGTLDGVTHADVALGQVWLGSLLTEILATLGVRPRAAIGYSLGESAALFAQRAWTDRDEMLGRMERSTLFTEELAGSCLAARRAWNLPPGEPVNWVLGMVDRPADDVREALRGLARAYLLIVNTPRECVVGGQRGAVEELVSRLRSAFHPIPGVTTVHCEVAASVRDAYRQLHMLPTKPPADVRFYSGVWGRAYTLTSDAAAESIVGQAVGPFDFTRVIRAAHGDGVRLFLELGPGSSCTRMIDQILADEPHAATALCVPRQDGWTSLLRCLALLASQGVAVDLDLLYSPPNPPPRSVPHERKLHLPVGYMIGTIPPPPSLLPPSPPPSMPTTPPQVAPSPSTPTSTGAVLATRMTALIQQTTQTAGAHAAAQQSYVALAASGVAGIGRAHARQQVLAQALGRTTPFPAAAPVAVQTAPLRAPQRTQPPTSLTREECLTFAVGRIGNVLGTLYAEVDRFPTRVRLPDEPLMLVDRVLVIEGEPLSLTSGRVVTEHDILPGAWYLDAGRIPTCIAVEAGQADLFLSGYLGIDRQTRGLSMYRLLDAVVTFHAPLPTAGATIHYDIRIERFFRQGDMHLFRFGFEATVAGRPLLSMRDGCAGFFTPEQLAGGQGVVQTAMDRREVPGKRPADWRDLVPQRVASYDDDQLAALRRGDLAACFGPEFAGLPLATPTTIPGGRMELVHRVLSLDPAGGRFGLGQIVGEADIHPDDWFLTCHFVDDQVMPGTLMYECCLHTLRIFLLRLGWIGAAGEVAHEPIPGVSSQLKCRGQVTAATRRVQYELTVKELGYDGPEETPYVLADALMYADGKLVVQMNNMSLRLTGLTRGKVERLWAHLWEANPFADDDASRPELLEVRRRKDSPPTENADPLRRRPLFDTDRILAFAVGKPSEAFGERYRVFDGERVIARLPGPPYQFLDRIVAIDNCQPWELRAGGEIEAEYDVPPDAWYFAADRQPTMPYAVLLEAALQPCGWLAAYLGSALTSDADLSFRNLGGRGVQLLPVGPDAGTLTTTIKITNVAQSGGMLIQNFDLLVRSRAGEVFRGDTYFGFFSKAALANQIGIRDATPYVPTAEETARAISQPLPTAAPFPDEMWRMVDQIELFDPRGGPQGLGYIRGTTVVRPGAWFFKAHFHQDPVWPGSLGLESMLQLLKFVAVERWGKSGVGGQGSGVGEEEDRRFQVMTLGQKHAWTYRGQILPTDRLVRVQAVVTAVDDASRTLLADGALWVDGRLIYQMERFGVTMTRL